MKIGGNPLSPPTVKAPEVATATEASKAPAEAQAQHGVPTDTFEAVPKSRLGSLLNPPPAGGTGVAPEQAAKELEQPAKELESKDRMGNFEIQRLMSTYNQAETLASSVQKKLDDTVAGQQQKIG